MAQNEKGQEIPDPTPVEVPLNFRRPPSLNDRIRSMIAREMSQYASAQGAETFEEANDFEVDEDPDFKSPYEVTELQEEAGFHDADNGDPKNASRQDTASPTTGKISSLEVIQVMWCPRSLPWIAVAPALFLALSLIISVSHLEFRILITRRCRPARTT